MKLFLEGFWNVINSNGFGEMMAVAVVMALVLIGIVVFAFVATIIQEKVIGKL